jgi:hypothetical protein
MAKNKMLPMMTLSPVCLAIISQAQGSAQLTGTPISHSQSLSTKGWKSTRVVDAKGACLVPVSLAQTRGLAVASLLAFISYPPPLKLERPVRRLSQVVGTYQAIEVVAFAGVAVGGCPVLGCAGGRPSRLVPSLVPCAGS